MDITNFREVGGIVNADGQRLRRGLVWRAAAPSYASRDQFAEIAGLGIKLICDFRSDGERPTDPTQWTEEFGVSYLLPNKGREVGDPLTALLKATVDRPTTYALLHEVYRAIPYDQAPAFRTLFARLAEGAFPVLYHCASGKDRTGVFTGMLLAMLGIQRESINADYELSNRWIEQITADFRNQPRLEPVWSSHLDAWTPLMASDRAWLDTMFATLCERHGSLEGYLEEVLGVGPAERAEIRRHLLE